jgi:hypothetical protein
VKAFIFPACAWLIVAAAAVEPNGYRLFSQERRGGFADQFFVNEGRLAKAARWDPEKSIEPPLSMAKATVIAREYVLKKEDVSKILLESVTLQRMSTRGPFQDIAYYRIQFNLGEFDHPVAIVLMDGTVVEPIRGSSKYDKADSQ